MGVYTSDHASAYADVAAAGFAVTFTRDTPGTEDSDGDFSGFATSSIAGVAFRKAGDPDRLRALGLTIERSVTLFFVPADNDLRAQTTDFVMADDSVSVNGVAFVVRDVGPTIAPDGLVIASDIIAAVG